MSMPDVTPRRGGFFSLHILHLEDAAADAELIAWTLCMAGIPCRITRVEDQASYSAALEHDIDLILSDSSVPGFSGTAALEMARTARVKAPFVFVSGALTAEARETALRLGAADYLAKDHRIQLVFLVRRVWQRKLDESEL